MRLKRWQSWTLRLVGTAALSVGILWFIPLSEVVGMLENVRVGYLASGFAVFLLGSYLQLSVREGSLVILVQYGVSSSHAVALAFLLFASILVGNGLGGLFEFKNVLLSGRGRAPARMGTE